MFSMQNVSVVVSVVALASLADTMPGGEVTTTAYTTDFESGVGPEWSSVRIDRTPSGRRFLGQFGNQTARLRLDNLPAHTRLEVSFDLFIIRSWDGNKNVGVGPDIWQLSVDESEILLRTTFTNVSFERQAYPGNYPKGNNPPQTGAAEVNTLGYTFLDYGRMDSVYHLTVAFPHTEDSVQVDFSADGLEEIWNESWGFDNVVVSTDGEAAYEEGFEGAVGREWLITTGDVTPAGGRRFLGRFQNDRVRLDLTNLPAHNEVTVAFDLFIIQSWDGNSPGHPEWGPDVWQLAVAGGETLLKTTFSNADGRLGTLVLNQAYPGVYPGGNRAPRSGAAENNTLGYVFTYTPGPLPTDTVYRIRRTFAHTADSLALIFFASNLQTYSLDDESWGLDNVVVTVKDVPHPPAAPTNLIVTPAPSQSLKLEWTAGDGNATTFMVQRRASNFCPWEPLTEVSAATTTYLDTKLPWSDQISYRVAARNDAGPSAWIESNPISHPAIPRWQLKLYRGGADMWVDLRPCDDRFQANRGTAVIVHGWNEPPGVNRIDDTWVHKTAQLIHERIPAGVNILAWDWLNEAFGIYPPEWQVEPQASLLAIMLRQTLPRGYLGPGHFIGHSLGARIVTTGALVLAQQGVVVPNVFPPAQVTQLDTPDWIGSGLLDNEVPELRRAGVYVDSYHGLTNLGTHRANLWVNVPGVSHRVDWYRDTIPMGRDPLLRQEASCFAEVLLGTVGFGTSILVTSTTDPERNRPNPGQCEETGTLQFSLLWVCSHLPGADHNVFGLDNYQECREDTTPFPTTFVGLDVGDLLCRQPGSCGSAIVNNQELLLNLSENGDGGGGQAGEELWARYVAQLTLSSEWDYLSFEYDFTEVAAEATLEATLTVDDTAYSVFLMTSGPVLPEGFLDTGLRDIRQLHGKEVILTFELRSAQPGATVHIRNLTFWRNPWNGNQPPIANAGPDQVVTATSDDLASVVLDGSATVDPDGDAPLQYWWMVEDGLLATGAQPTVELPSGRYPVTLIVRDPADNVGADEVLIVVLGGYVRGDSNGDGGVDISDAINMLGFLFTGGGTVTCQDAADANDDGTVDISDAIFILGFLFLGTPSIPPEPYPNRGLDPTVDTLDCDSYEP